VSKFLLNLLVQISKALVNSKIQFLFRKAILFSSDPVGQAAPPACLAFRRSGLRPNPLIDQHAKPAQRPRIPFPLPSPTRAGAHVTASPMHHPRHVRHPLSPTDAMEPQRLALPPLNSTPHQLTIITPPPPLNSGNWRLQAEALTLAMKPRLLRPLWPPIKGRCPTRSSPHLSPLSFSSLCAQASPAPSASSTISSPSSPGHHTATRAQVRPEMDSPCTILSIPPPPVSHRGPERQLGRAPVRHCRGPIRGPPWTGATQSPRMVDRVHRISH
jgi:hypothetical protein